MYLFIWIIFGIYACGISSIIDETVGKFIIDVTSSVHSASSLTAFLCVNTDDAVGLSKQMSKNHVLNDIQLSFADFEFSDFGSRVAHQIFYVVDFDCHDAVGLLIKANERQMFVAPAKWLIFKDLGRKNYSESFGMENSKMREDNGQSEMKTFLEKLDIFPDSEIFVGKQDSNDENMITLMSFYRPSRYRNLVIENRGSWNVLDGLLLENHDPSSRRRRNLQKTPLKSCLVVTNPDTMNHLTDAKYKFVDTITKANYPSILHIVNRMNASVSFIETNTWGYEDKNGSWNGMIGYLDRGEIDIGGTPTFLVPQRIGVVDYVQLYTPTRAKFLFRRPPLSYVSNLFTLPFSVPVWIAIGFYLSLIFCLLYISMKWEFKRLSCKKEKESESLSDLTTNPTASDNLLILFGAISQQGFFYEAKFISTRIVILMLLLAALSLYAAYTANIVALLQSTTNSIRTFTDLMNSPLKFGIHDIVYNRYYFSKLDDPMRKEFYDRVVKDKSHIWMNVTEGIARVRKGLFAFHIEQSVGFQLMQETYEEHEKCGIHEIDILNLPNPLLVIKRQSPYRELIRVGSLWIHETGLQKRDLHRIYTAKPICVSRTSFVSVGITDCHAAMLIIGTGIAITLGIFILEIIWKKCFVRDENEIGFEDKSSEGRTSEVDFVSMD